MKITELKVVAEKQLVNELYSITWFDNDTISIGIDWQNNKIVVADSEHPDGATVEIGSFSDLRVVWQVAE